jgi:hypothetical protein
MTGCSFLDLIRPGDIAYMIALDKNVRDVWDQTVQMEALVGSCCTQGIREIVKAFIHLRDRQKEGARLAFVE